MLKAATTTPEHAPLSAVSKADLLTAKVSAVLWMTAHPPWNASHHAKTCTRESTVLAFWPGVHETQVACRTTVWSKY